jgi:hypothetical protein
MQVFFKKNREKCRVRPKNDSNSLGWTYLFESGFTPTGDGYLVWRQHFSQGAAQLNFGAAEAVRAKRCRAACKFRCEPLDASAIRVGTNNSRAISPNCCMQCSRKEGDSNLRRFRRREVHGPRLVTPLKASILTPQNAREWQNLIRRNREPSQS